jgi:hypothetical protein
MLTLRRLEGDVEVVVGVIIDGDEVDGVGIELDTRI